MQCQIRGTTLQVADVQLAEGESVYTESGGMAWMTPNIEMKTDTHGGLMKGIGRMFSGESLFMNTYTCTTGNGIIAFACEFPGKIVPLNLAEGQELICQKDAFMFAQSSVNLAVHFQKKLGAGFFGGEGFILNKITGPGQAYLELAGEITEYNLQAGQQFKIDPGYIGAFEPSVKYDISRIKGFKNAFFGGEGLFLATLEGPGKIWLQSMPLANLAHKLGRFIPKSTSGGNSFLRMLQRD
jgi:uncharacterized protein (TIGR00266 family)